jgi:hypothetical protein
MVPGSRMAFAIYEPFGRADHKELKLGILTYELKKG